MTALMRPTREPAPSPRATAVLLGGLMAVALGVRLRQYTGSLFGDELSAYYIATNHSLGDVLHILYGHSVDLNPPLYFMLAWLSEQLFGNSAEALRLVSLLAGIAAVPLTYALGRMTFGRGVGLLAAALVALSPFLTFYSTEARPYSLLLTLVLLSTLSLLQARRTDRVGWWAAYALFSAAAVYTQFTSVFPIAALFVWAFITSPESRLRLVASSGAAALAFLPWLPALIKNTHSPGKELIAALQSFGPSAIRLDFGRLALGHPYLPLDVVPGRVALAGLLAVAAVTVIAFAVRARRGPAGAPRAPEPLPPVLLLVAAPVGVGIYSALTASIWDSRNLITAWAGLAVVVAALVLAPRVRLRLAAVVLLLAATALGVREMQRTTTQRPDYRAVAGFVAAHGAPDDPVVDFPSFTPGPPTETEAALALATGSSGSRPVLRVGSPPLRAVLSAPPYATLPEQSGRAVAREAVAAARSRRLFVVLPGSFSLQVIDGIRSGRPIATFLKPAQLAFLRALPPRWRVVSARTYPGLADVTVVLVARRG